MRILLNCHRVATLILLLAVTDPAMALGQVGTTPDDSPPEPRQVQQPDDPEVNQPDDPGVTETVTVTATRLPARLADMPTAVRVWSGESLQQLPAVMLDDALRWLPSVSLFRRTSSRAAHPTSQGINLRGLAPSGVSRALVLVDGVPLNDPFGGWVYWDRVPLLAIDSIEVAAGGGSAPYGNQALGGVVQLVTRGAGRTGLQLQALGGSDATARVGLAAGTSHGSVAMLAAAEVFHTGGYVATAPASRGAVDTPVSSSHQAARIRFDLPATVTIVAEGLRERRGNGTPLQTNKTRLGGVSGSWRREPGGKFGGWSLHAFARSQTFESNFSSVAPGRDSERLVLKQRVPATDLGVGGLAWLPLGDNANLSTGADWRRASGHSKELVVVINRRRAPGGRQHLGGAYAAIDWTGATQWSLSLALRADGWHQTPVDTPGEARGAATLSPRAGIVWHPARQTTIRASTYRAFRAPTLNELYRQFRVGNTQTFANPELEQEQLWGAEFGGSWSGWLDAGRASRLTIDSTFYWNHLEDAIINATESTTPSLILRRRRNLGAATVRGVELNGRLELDEQWRVSAAVAWLGARISDEPEPTGPSTGAGDRADLEGNRLPQVPEYRARGSVGYLSPGGWSALASVAAVSVQFEDDQNLLPLASAVTVDASAQLPLTEGLQLTLRAENLLDHDVPVKRTPTLTLGPPRLVYAGITVNWPAGRR